MNNCAISDVRKTFVADNNKGSLQRSIENVIIVFEHFHVSNVEEWTNLQSSRKYSCDDLEDLNEKYDESSCWLMMSTTKCLHQMSSIAENQTLSTVRLYYVQYVEWIRFDIDTSTCWVCMYYKINSIVIFTIEQFINSILYYHCAHFNHLMLLIQYQSEEHEDLRK